MQRRAFIRTAAADLAAAPLIRIPSRRPPYRVAVIGFLMVRHECSAHNLRRKRFRWTDERFPRKIHSTRDCHAKTDGTGHTGDYVHF